MGEMNSHNCQIINQVLLVLRHIDNINWLCWSFPWEMEGKWDLVCQKGLGRILHTAGQPVLEPRIGKRPVWLEVTEGGVWGRGWSDCGLGSQCSGSCSASECCQQGNGMMSCISKGCRMNWMIRVDIKANSEGSMNIQRMMSQTRRVMLGNGGFSSIRRGVLPRKTPQLRYQVCSWLSELREESTYVISLVLVSCPLPPAGVCTIHIPLWVSTPVRLRLH